MSGIAASFTALPSAAEENNVSGSFIVETKQVENVDAILNRLLMLDESDFKPSMETEPEHQPQPLLGGNEIFGLWIHIIYKDRYGNIKYDGTEPITLDLQTIKGKLGSPSYRTPIKFNVDDDPGYDIETGFGFFRSGIDEIGTNTNHPGWATAFDFKQIYDGLDDQEGELEVWQEFHLAQPHLLLVVLHLHLAVIFPFSMLLSRLFNPFLTNSPLLSPLLLVVLHLLLVVRNQDLW
jgi:hypothetical protein